MATTGARQAVGYGHRLPSGRSKDRPTPILESRMPTTILRAASFRHRLERLSSQQLAALENAIELLLAGTPPARTRRDDDVSRW